MQKLQTIILKAQKTLTIAGIDHAALISRELIAYELGRSRLQLMMQPERELSQIEIDNIQKLIDRCALHEPLSRILGKTEFRGLTFGLNEATLDPRQDSETLVEAVLKEAALNSGRPSKEDLRILDLGTGTGCLLLSLLHELPSASGVGVDISPRAVEQAQINSSLLGLANKARFVVSKWGENIDEKFDIVVSNPPYIEQKVIETLMPEVRNYDPELALDGGEDGLEAYRQIIPQLHRLLNPNGLVAFEVGQGQAQSVREMLETSGLSGANIYNDLSDIERCVTAEL